ncbi:MAG: flagellar biosynthetic protein FliR [bacterium]
MELSAILIHKMAAYILALVRVTALFLVAPLFGSRQIPTAAKIGFSAIFTFILFPFLKDVALPLNTPWVLALTVARELLVGLIIGFIALFIFLAFQMAAQILDMQMGFILGSVIEPGTGSQESLIGRYQHVLALLIFLAINGHLWLVRALRDSFHLIPAGSFTLPPAFMEDLLKATSGLFVTALMLASPTLVALFLTDLGMALLSRAIPQINVFIVGFPVKILIGLYILGLSLGLVLSVFSERVQQGFADLLGMMGRMH